jgi:hypothetical protein
MRRAFMQLRPAVPTDPGVAAEPEHAQGFKFVFCFIAALTKKINKEQVIA